MRIRVIALAVMTLLVAGVAMADPLLDGAGWFTNHDAAWIPNGGQNCGQVCAPAPINALAETEQHIAGPVQRTFLCKFDTNGGGPGGPGWVYGNNYIPALQGPFCDSVNTAGNFVTAANFLCLCVR